MTIVARVFNPWPRYPAAQAQCYLDGKFVAEYRNHGLKTHATEDRRTRLGPEAYVMYATSAASCRIRRLRRLAGTDVARVFP
ncbi:MAG: hypothetical protein JWN24_936 [Phycisphaerales bacterium]|nr:hypothetical protein [Phycisphaerales bacterium]